jgi:hypothetical protein
MRKLQVFGVVLLASAVFAAVVLGVLGLLVIEVGRTSTSGGGPSSSWEVTKIDVVPNWPLAVPVGLTGLAGLGCLVIPAIRRS